MGWRKTETGGWHYVQTQKERERAAKRPTPPRRWVQSDACPKCNTLVWTPFTYEQYDVCKSVKAVCKNCGNEWVAAIREGDYTSV